jgi:hypothetical protein
MLSQQQPTLSVNDTGTSGVDFFVQQLQAGEVYHRCPPAKTSSSMHKEAAIEREHNSATSASLDQRSMLP